MKSTRGAFARRCLGMLIAAALLNARSVSATKMVPAELSELVAAARAIIHGRVVQVSSVDTADRRNVDTLVTLAADEYLKGGLGRIVTFRALGGETGRYRSIFVGAPTFRVGDEVILLLGAQGPSIPYVLGVSQGVFRIRHDEAGARMVVPPPVQGFGDAAMRLARGDPARQPLALELFKAEVRRLVAASDR